MYFHSSSSGMPLDSLLWHARWCVSKRCVGDMWHVKRMPQQASMWWVVGSMGEQPMTVASDVPLCPRCGQPLAAACEIEEGLGQCTESEAAVLREWLSIDLDAA